jgi:hypothetical protein
MHALVGELFQQINRNDVMVVFEAMKLVVVFWSVKSVVGSGRRSP